MGERAPSLAQIQEVPKKSLMLLAGPPGAGKSTFCHQVVLNGLAMDKPVIFVTTEHGPSEVIGLLREKGLGEPTPGALNFVDAYSQTVGIESPERPDTIYANCMDLNSISIATTKLQERMGQRGILLAFDSLTSPYILSGAEVTRFMRLFLSKFTAEGNGVLALLDEGCSKPEDLVGMMSIADGVIRIQTEKDKQLLNLVKHPKLGPTRIEVPLAPSVGLEAVIFDLSALEEFIQAMVSGREKAGRKEVGDFVNLFWPNLSHWSGMLWDPKRFPTMMYELNKEDTPAMFKLAKEDEAIKRAVLPWSQRLFIRFFAPKNFSKVKDVKRMMSVGKRQSVKERTGIVEYLEDISKTDEHYFRIYECSDCWGFEHMGAAMASYLPPVIAGMLKGFEYSKGLERDWNAVETKCIGLGDPYCEFKVVPGEVSGLKDSLQKDSSVIERIHQRLMDRLMRFLLRGGPLVERPRLGSDIHIHAVMHAMGGEGIPAMGTTWSQRYGMALRMGGAKSGKEVGERLTNAGLSGDEAVRRVLHVLEHCKVGKATIGETIRIRENCEPFWTKLFATKWREPCCFFTTGFLNGFFSAVKNQHVRETKCIAMGDPYCEWEIV